MSTVTSPIQCFSETTKQKLKYYVYAYAYYDPATIDVSGLPFYIGEGSGDRAFAHLKETRDAQSQGTISDTMEKVKQIDDILQRGEMPIIKIVRHGLDKATALAVEAALIDSLRRHLRNKQGGYESNTYGLMEAVFLDRVYSDEVQMADFSTLDAEAILVNLNRTCRDRLAQGYSMDTLFSPIELYDATRMAWRIDNAISTQGDTVDSKLS